MRVSIYPFPRKKKSRFSPAFCGKNRPVKEVLVRVKKVVPKVPLLKNDAAGGRPFG